MNRQIFPSSDPYNSFNSFSPYDLYDNSYNSSSRYNSDNYSIPSTSYNSSSYNNYFSYRKDGCPNHYEEAPSMQYQMTSYNERSIQYQRGNQSNNTNNFGWSCEPKFTQEEGNNYGYHNYQWEPSSLYEMPTPPHLTAPIQQKSRSNEYQALLDELNENLLQLKKYNDEEQERLNGLRKNYLARDAAISRRYQEGQSLSQLELLAEKHEHDYVLQPALSFHEQVEKDEPSPEEDSEDEGNTIVIYDIPFVTSSFSCDAGQQFNDEDHTMQDETATCTSNILASDESYTPLSDLVAHFMYDTDDDSDYTGIVQWVIIREVIEHQEDLENENESIKGNSKDEGDVSTIDDFVSVTPPPFSCVDTGKWCDENQNNLGAAEVPKEIMVLEKEEEEEAEEEEYLDPSTEQGKQCNEEDNFSCPCNGESCKYCQEIEEWLTMDQSLETAEISKVIEEEEEREEKEFVDPPPISIHKQLEIEKPPLYIDFVISFHSTTASLPIFNFISLCGVGMKKIISEEHADQRVGSITCSLQRRPLLPLWIFKENLKPD